MSFANLRLEHTAFISIPNIRAANSQKQKHRLVRMAQTWATNEPAKCVYLEVSMV